MAHFEDLETLENQYHSDIARYSLPATVIATKATEDGAKHQGSERSVHHDHWLVEVENPKNLRKTQFWVPFDTVVGANALRLNDPRLLLDYCLKKIVIIAGLSRLYGMKFTTKDSVLQASRQFDWHVRWRLGRDIWSNEDLKKVDIDAFLAIIESGDIIRLVPVFERLENLLNKLADGQIPFSDLLYDIVEERFNWQLVSDEIGVPYTTLSRSSTFKLALTDGLARLQHHYGPTILAALKPPRDANGPEGYTGGGARNVLRPLQIIYRISAKHGITKNRLTFDPFYKRSARSLIKQAASVPSARTPTLFPEDYIRLLRAALQWTFSYHEYVDQALNLLRREADISTAERVRWNNYLDSIRPEGAPKLYLAWMMSKKTATSLGDRIAVGHAAKLLLSSTALVIGCFAARRSTELASLKVGCIEEAHRGLLLNVYIEKTNRDIFKFPVPVAVRRAVEIVERLGTTDAGRSEWLFEIPRFGEFKVGFDPTENIREFVNFIKLPPPVGTTEWDLAAHVLRRGFAIFLYFGDEWATLDDVTYALQHFDPNMTRIYISEILPGEIHRLQDELRGRLEVSRENETPEFKAWRDETERRLSELTDLQKDVGEVQLEAYIFRMMSLHRGTDKVIGGLAQQLYSDLDTLVDQAAADVRIVSRSNDPTMFENALIDRLKVRFADRSLEPVPGGVMHCGARRGNQEDLDNAECLKDKKLAEITWGERSVGKPDYVDFAYSGALPCVRCVHGAAFACNRRVLDNKEEKLKTAVEGAPSPAAAAARQNAYQNFRNAYVAAKAKTGGRR